MLFAITMEYLDRATSLASVMNFQPKGLVFVTSLDMSTTEKCVQVSPPGGLHPSYFSLA